MKKTFLIAMALSVIGCSDDKHAQLARNEPPATAAEIVIPEGAKPPLRKLLEAAWPKVRSACPGLDRYAREIQFKEIAENSHTTIVFTVPQNAKLPNEWGVQGHTCYFEIAKNGSYLQISKNACQSLCLDRQIDSDAAEMQMPLLGDLPSASASGQAVASIEQPPPDAIAQKLAQVSLGRAPLAKDIRRAKKALKEALAICKQDEGELLYLSLAFSSKLAELAQQVVLPIELIELMPAIFHGSKEQRDCRQVMVNYAAGRTGTRQSHAQGVVAMRQLHLAGVAVDEDLSAR